MSAVGKAIGGVTKTIFGGGSSTPQNAGYSKPSEQEQNLFNQQQGNVSNASDQQSQQYVQDQNQANDLTGLFQDHLKDFLTHSSPNDPRSMQSAQDFVDKTFTNPAQAAVNQQVGNYESEAQAKASMLGRNPNADVATNQAIAGEAMRQNLGLQMQRGQMIGNQYQQNFNNGLQGLGAGMQGSGFLNNLAQQAMTNRLNLMNTQSNNLNYLQRGRMQSAGPVQHDAGILGSITGAAGQIAGTAGAIGGLGQTVKGMGMI